MSYDPHHVTPSEKKIARLVGEGLTDTEIAAILGWKKQTVKNYVHRLFNIFHVNCRITLAVLFNKDLPLDSPVKKWALET